MDLAFPSITYPSGMMKTILLAEWGHKCQFGKPWDGWDIGNHYYAIYQECLQINQDQEEMGGCVCGYWDNPEWVTWLFVSMEQ